jgi:hypothetical protein
MDNDLPPHIAPFALRAFMAFVLIGALAMLMSAAREDSREANCDLSETECDHNNRLDNMRAQE